MRLRACGTPAVVGASRRVIDRRRRRNGESHSVMCSPWLHTNRGGNTRDTVTACGARKIRPRLSRVLHSMHVLILGALTLSWSRSSKAATAAYQAAPSGGTPRGSWRGYTVSRPHGSMRLKSGESASNRRRALECNAAHCGRRKVHHRLMECDANANQAVSTCRAETCLRVTHVVARRALCARGSRGCPADVCSILKTADSAPLVWYASQVHTQGDI